MDLVILMQWRVEFTRVHGLKLRVTLGHPPFPPVIRQLQRATKEKQNIESMEMQNAFEAYKNKTRCYFAFLKSKNVLLFTVAGFACCLAVSFQWMMYS